MKLPAACLLTALASASLVGALSPLSRVVELLQGLSAKIDEEGKAEEGLYKKFVCWGESNIAAKTESNQAAQSRIDSLKSYIADIEVGRVEFTTERVDLEKELGQLTSDIETAASLRAKEKADFEDAKLELDQGIAALQEAIRILKEAAGGKSSSMMALKGQLRGKFGFAARSAEAATLLNAADIGDRFLSKGDARFLRRLLTGDVPNYNWKKLNRKADFKKSYEARSGNIQEVLLKLLTTFKSNLAEATAKESEAQQTYDTLAAAKGAQKAAAQEALLKMEKEMGARGMSKAEAQAEVDGLTAQVADDTTYIQQVKQSVETKKSEWSARSQLRAKELQAISEAIKVLHSDESRDTFKKSLDSQGYSFLQVRMVSVQERARSQAMVVLQRAAQASHDSRLQGLLSQLTKAGHFDAVMQAIDGMLAVLRTEEGNDLQQKEHCEEDRASDTRAASEASRTIDELADQKASLLEETKDLDAQMEEANKEIASIRAELEEAAKLRQDAANAHVNARADDTAAAALVERAKTILTKFYADNNLMLLSKKRKQAPTSAAGQAPPPPPATWEAPYGGKTGESNGIISILIMIADDISKDIASADAAENSAITEYNRMKTEQEGAIGNLQTLIGTLQGTKSQKEGDIQTAEGERSLKKQELDALFKKMKDAQPGCDFITVNFAVRSKNRQIEMDGLVKAKAILQGAQFTK